VAEFSFTYRAFISYAHADHKWAVWLHRALERYRVPRRLAGAEGVRRLGKCFRDEEELAAAAELGPKIAKALQSSDVLIVVCSPRSAKSKWVNQEIEAFKAQGREHRVFALIVDGTPHGAPDAAGNPTECFPEALKRTAAGGLAEPLAVDVRKFGREDAAVRLIAGMLDVGYDDLRQREVRRRRGEMVRAQAILITGLLLTAGALTGGWFAASNYVDASERSSSLFAQQAGVLSAEDQHAKGLLMALYGDPAARAGPVEQLLRPAGYPALREMLARSYTRNRLIGSFTVGEGTIYASAFSPDGKSALIGGQDGKVTLMSTVDGKVLRTWDLNDDIVAVAFSPQDETLLIAEERSAYLYRASNDVGLVKFAGQSGIISAAFSPDGGTIAIGAFNGTATLWSAADGKLITTIKAHDENVYSVAFSGDGMHLLTGGEDGMAKLWRVSGGPPLATYTIGANVSSAAFTPDGKSVFGGSNGGPATLWSIEYSQLQATLDEDMVGVRSAAFSRDGKLIVTGSDGGTVRLWDLVGDRGRVLTTFLGHEGAVTSVAFSPDGTKVLTASADKTVKLWRTFEGQRAAELERYNDWVSAVAFSPDGEKVLVASRDATAKLVPAGGGVALATFVGHTHWITSAAISPDGTKIVTGSYDGTARVWPASGGEELAILQGHTDRIQSVAFSPDGTKVLTGSTDKTAKIWAVSGGEALATFLGHTEEITSVAFSPDGSRILTGSYDRTAKIWPASGGEALMTLGGHEDAVETVAFSPDGKRVMTGAGLEQHFIRIWSAASGRQEALLDGNQNLILDAAFSPDGASIMTVSYSGVATLWPVSGGEALETFTEYRGPLTAAAFSLDGRRLVTGSEKGEVAVWTIDPVLHAGKDEQVRLACERLKEVGVMEFTKADQIRFSILGRNAPHPCAKAWGFDPRVKREAAMAKAN
jgi:WD40 repeat protein